MSNDVIATEWTVKDSAIAQEIVIEVQGEEGKNHFITFMAGGYDKDETGTITFESPDDSDFVSLVVPISDAGSLAFPNPLRWKQGKTIKATLSAPQAAKNGFLTIGGYTR